MQVTRAVDDYLFGWVLAAVLVGFLVPAVAVVTRFSTTILAVMVGSVSLTLDAEQFRDVDGRGLASVLLGHVAMPFLAFGLARALGLSPALTAGFVLVGAVTPELVTPTMTELAGGDTALAAVALVAIGIGSTLYLPVVASFLLGADVSVDTVAIVHQLLVAVVAPMALAVGIRTRYGEPVARYEAYYSTVSALMVVLIMAGVAGANAALVREHVALLAPVAAGAVALNALGYAVGWAASLGRAGPVRVAAALSVGMRDFAVAAALVVAAGFPPAAALPAVVFGVVEMASSATLARAVG